MKKMKKCDMFKQIEEDFNDPIREVCRTLFLFLISDNARTITHYTYKTLINGSGIDVSTSDDYVLLIKATDYFSSCRAHLLEMHFQYIDSSYDEPIYVEDDIVSYAIDTGKFYHPETGALVPDFEISLFPYFIPTKQLGELHE